MRPNEPEWTLNTVNAALEADTRLDVDGLSLELDPDRRVLRLEGTVSDIRRKRLACNVVRGAIKDAYRIEDRLHVEVTSEGQLQMRDEVVRSLAMEGMFAEHTVVVEADGHRETVHQGQQDAGAIEIRIEDGVVTLMGQVVSHGHRSFAEVLMWWLPGTSRVDNRIAVVPEEEFRDNDVTDVVRMVFEKDPLVHAAQLNVGTAGGVVELRGLVKSEEERRLAVFDTWYVPGVWEVVDHIEVQP